MVAGDGSRRRVLVGGSVVVALIAIGALLSQLGGGAPNSASDVNKDQPPPRPVVQAGEAGPISERAGMPVGFSQDEEGAVAAAIAYATAPQRWLYFTDDEIAAAVTEIATSAAAPRLVDEVVADVRVAREQLGASSGRVWWLVRPLAWHLELHTAGEAQVTVWLVTVLSAAEVAAPQTEWMSVSVALEWAEDDWRLDGIHESPGPTPMTGPRDEPWNAEPFDETLQGFIRMDGEPVT
jgi:hypothetical protein